MWINSKYVEKGDCFLVNCENEKYIDDAVKNGAKLIITELDKKYRIKTIHTKNIKHYLYSNYYNYIKDLSLIGITGTNGKTTTCYLIYQMLNMIGIKTAYIGTIGFYIDGLKKELDNTTPSVDILYNLLLDAKGSGCKVVVMEVSSHALKQDRLYGLLFDGVGVTNITQDHMDYHKTMHDYVESKKKIINMLKSKKVCILNKKDKYYKKFKNKQNKNYIIGRDIKIKNVKMNLDNTTLLINDKNKIKIRLSLVGMFNVYNYLMAYKLVKELGYDVSKILNNSYILTEPPGRMQKIKFKDNVIFIDYAHTPDAVKKVLKTVRNIKNRGVITIIGCGGNRDKTKRSIMGNITCKYSNYVIFTNDNPRNEDEKDIMKDILKGAKGKYEVIYDRKEAIKRGVNSLDGNKILMVLGKGHENYQIVGDEKHYFSDYECVDHIVNSTS